MVTLRPWMKRILRIAEKSDNPEKAVEQMVEEHGDEEDVFGMGLSPEELRSWIESLGGDAKELKREGKTHFKKYQHYLKRAYEAEENSIDWEDARFDAGEELEQAKLKRSEYRRMRKLRKLLKKALSHWVLKQKREQRQSSVGVSVDNLDLAGARQGIDDVVEDEQKWQQKLDELGREMEMLGDVPEPDMEDVDKDLDELQAKHSGDMGGDWSGPEMPIDEEDEDLGDEDLEDLV